VPNNQTLAEEIQALIDDEMEAYSDFEAYAQSRYARGSLERFAESVLEAAMRHNDTDLLAEHERLQARYAELLEQALTADLEANTWQDRAATRAGTEVKLREEISRLRAVIREWYESNQALDAFTDPPRGTAHTRSYRDWRDTERRALDAEDAISRVALEKEYNMFHKESTVTTRKTYQCEGCDEDIESGAPGEAFAGGSQRAFAWETQQEEFNRFLLRDNTAMRKAGGKLATAALHVVHEYDGLHRLMLAVSEWSQVVTGEGGRATEKTEAAVKAWG